METKPSPIDILLCFSTEFEILIMLQTAVSNRPFYKIYKNETYCILICSRHIELFLRSFVIWESDKSSLGVLWLNKLYPNLQSVPLNP